MDAAAVRAAARDCQVVWLCSPNNPTALAEPDGAIERLLDELAEDAAAAGPRRRPRSSRSTRPTRNSSGRRCSPSASGYPNLIVVRTASKAYALAGLRVGFAVAQRETIARIAPYRPPGSVATTTRHDRHRGAPRPERDARERRPGRARARPSRRRASGGRLARRPVRDELPAGRLRDAAAGRARPPRHSCGVASCRGRSGPATRSPIPSG